MSEPGMSESGLSEPNEPRLSPLRTLFWAKRRISLHYLASVREESKLKVIFVSLSAVVLWLVIFAFSFVAFRLFEIFGAEVLDEGSLTVSDIVVARLLSVFALVVFVMLIFSNVLVSFATFYRSREVPYLVLSPISTSTLFLGRFRECVSFSSWAAAFLGSPIMLAYGLTTGAPILFYPMLVAFYVPFVVIPASIGAMISMLLVRFFSHIKQGPVVMLGVAVVAALFGYFRGKLVAPDLANTGTVQGIVDTMSRTQAPWLPSYWLSQGVLSAATGAAAEALFYFLALTLNAVFLLWLATWVAEKIFYSGWSAFYGGGEKQPAVVRGPLRHLDRLLGWLPEPTRALMVKDFRLFWRDPAQWAQFVIFFGIMALYIANLGGAGSFARRGQWGEWTTLLNLTACMLILASLTSRFVYPLVSLEGPRIWIVGLAPVSMKRIIWQKFWLSFGTTSVFTVSLAVLSAVRLKLEPTAFALSVLAILATTVALSGMSVGLGSLYPNFQEDNPSRIVSGMGGTLNFILSMIYIVLITIALAVVLLWGDGWRLIFGSLSRAVTMVTIFILVLTFIACWMPMRLGLRNLERTEF